MVNQFADMLNYHVETIMLYQASFAVDFFMLYTCPFSSFSALMQPPLSLYLHPSVLYI